MKYIFCLELKINCIKYIPTDKLKVSNTFFKKISGHNSGQGLLYKLLPILRKVGIYLVSPNCGLSGWKEKWSFINSFPNLGLHLMKQTIYHNQVNIMSNVRFHQVLQIKSVKKSQLWKKKSQLCSNIQKWFNGQLYVFIFTLEVLLLLQIRGILLHEIATMT